MKQIFSHRKYSKAQVIPPVPVLASSDRAFETILPNILKKIQSSNDEYSRQPRGTPEDAGKYCSNGGKLILGWQNNERKGKKNHPECLRFTLVFLNLH